MRRRSRRAPNLSESTGKIGQQLPSNQPAPLVPLYPDESAAPQRRPDERRPDERHQDERHQDERRQDERHREERRQEPRPANPPPAQRQESQRQQAQRPEWPMPSGGGRLEMETQPETPSAPPGVERSAQAPKGVVVLAIGLPGSGKTTWFGRRGVSPLSGDLLRGILFDDVEEQRYQGLVFSTLRSMLRARLIAHMPWNYVDATNLSIHERRQWIKMAKSFGYEVHAVFFDVPLEVCLERNSKRDRSVSEDVMRKMAEKLKPPVFEEGFEKITVVRVKNAG